MSNVIGVSDDLAIRLRRSHACAAERKCATNPRGEIGRGKVLKFKRVMTPSVPERTDHQFVQVVTGDIFYDAAAAFGGDTFAGDKFHAKEKIARGAVELAQGPSTPEATVPPTVARRKNGTARGRNWLCWARALAT